MNNSNYTLPKGKVLVLRSCKSDMTSHGGFKWPEEGEVESLDFKNNNECGYGLHGWLWATGDFSMKVKDHYAKWLVVEVDEESTIELVGKVKFQKGNVIYTGTYRNAFMLVMKWFWLSQSREKIASTTGYYAHASTTGYYAHASSTGDSAHASTTGDSAHASTTGYSAHASSTGDSAHASTTGNYGAACVLGVKGVATCGKNGSIVLTYWDGKRNRHVVAYEGEGIEANVAYKLNEKNELVKA